MTEKTSHLDQDLQGRDKAELIAMINLMLQQRPELTWVLQASQPLTDKRAQSIDTNLYRQQIEAAVSAAVKHSRDRAYREVLRNTLATFQAAADEFAQKANYLAALSIYEVLIAEAVKHYFTVETGYLIFTPILTHCTGGLDSCVAEAGGNQEMRLRAFKGLFAIYCFSASSILDLGEDIPDLLVGNSTREECPILAGWVRDELARVTNKAGSDEDRRYRMLLRRLEKEDLATDV